MDQDTLVREQIEGGAQSIEALREKGFEIRIAFWAKPTDDAKWFLYLASPVVDTKGLQAAYRIVHGLIRQRPDLWLDPFEMRAIGENDSLAKAAWEVIKPRMPSDQFAVPNPKPYVGGTWFRGSTLGGVDVDGAYIYAPLVATGV
jgi:hypothetical protein